MKQRNGRRSGELERVGSELRQWRGRKRGGGRIPEDLWEQAASLCAEHGVSRVSRELKLDYHGLKRRAKSVPASGPETGEFVEIPGGVGGGWTECRVELEAPGGVRLCLELRSGEAVDIGALGARLWEAAK